MHNTTNRVSLKLIKDLINYSLLKYKFLYDKSIESQGAVLPLMIKPIEV